MTEREFELIEQAMLNMNNEAVVACAEFVRMFDKDLSNKLLETFIFKDVNELREQQYENIAGFAAQESKTKTFS